MPAQRLKVLHASGFYYLPPSQTYVHSRVLNPICQRPVPVVTSWAYPEYRACQEINFHEESPSYVIQYKDKNKSKIPAHTKTCSSLYCQQVIAQVHPQLIHAHFARVGERCLSIARSLSIPLVINFYGVETNRDIYDPRWTERLKKIYTEADALICSSRQMKCIMQENGCSGDKIRPIPCGIDTNFFCGAVTPWEPGQTLNLISIARLHPDKGLTYLLDACELLNRSGFTDWQLTIIGHGQSEAALQQQSRDNGLQDQVSFLQHQSPFQVRDRLRSAHLKILPSLKEAQGIALLEAQAMSTPVIASNVGGISEGLLDGKTGFLCDPRSPQALLEKIQLVLEAPSLLEVMGHAGHLHVEKLFSRDKEYQELASLYQSLTQ